jgi:hypothetical protein
MGSGVGRIDGRDVGSRFGRMLIVMRDPASAGFHDPASALQL